MIAFILGPIGRYVAAIAAVVVVLGWVYVEIRSDAISETIAISDKEALRRTQNAIASGDAAATDPERLLEDDGHRRE